MNIDIIIGIIAVLIITTGLYFILLRRFRHKRLCPSCGRVQVPGREKCPFCGAAYQPNVALTRFDRGASPPPLQAPVLLCLQGSCSGQIFPIIFSEFSIGRSPDNRLHLKGMLVSRHHALITLKDNQYLLYDRESTNGTYVNGQRIAQHSLQSGDQIQIGPFVFVFQRPGVPVPPRQEVPPVERVPTPAPAVKRAVNLDDYEIGEPIGGGGMATVYKGLSRQDGSVVAIKVFHQTDPYLQDKFEQEIRIGINMPPHPHIARVYNGGSSGGIYYMLMEYVDNGSLRERLRGGRPLPFDEIVPIIGQTCDALHHAHRLGIYHRDIKPENILFSSRDGVKLVDFGIAKLATAVTRTMDGMIVGTPFYMSYEQAQGARVDGRSDLYSLGTVLYEMLTGRPPFTGEPLTVLHKHLTEEPPKPRHFNASIPPHIEKVVMRALEKDIGKRFQSAEEMARALGYTTPFSVPAARSPEAPPVPAGPLPPIEPYHPRPPLACLIVVHSGQEISLTAPTTFLRRRDVNPRDMLISRERHARILCQGGQFWLEDMGSTNGTYLNEQRIFDAKLLQHGDLIRLGQTRLRFLRREQ